MPREDYPGWCDGCRHQFRWYLMHNGFNSSCHAYCSLCGATALLSFYAAPLEHMNARPGGILREFEPLLASCDCGGRFTASAYPRCPACAQELSAAEASQFIEPSIPATKNGWMWQRLWTGDRALYAIVVDHRYVDDPFIAK